MDRRIDGRIDGRTGGRADDVCPVLRITNLVPDSTETDQPGYGLQAMDIEGRQGRKETVLVLLVAGWWWVLRFKFIYYVMLWEGKSNSDVQSHSEKNSLFRFFYLVRNRRVRYANLEISMSWFQRSTILSRCCGCGCGGFPAWLLLVAWA